MRQCRGTSMSQPKTCRTASSAELAWCCDSAQRHAPMQGGPSHGRGLRALSKGRACGMVFAGKKGSGNPAVPWRLPPGVLETLEVLVMEPAQLAGEHAALDALEPSAGAESRGVKEVAKADGSAMSEGAWLMQTM